MKTLDIYTEHFKMRERPFTLVPDPDFLYWSPMHKRAYAILEYGIVTRGPITLITGEVGSGKTTLLHHLLRSIEDDLQIGLVSNAQGDRGELLRWILSALDQPTETNATYVQLFEQFQSYLIDQYAQNKRVIVIVDEAQNLSRENLEELRMFTNINSNKDELFQLVLVGQPELREIVMRPDLSQFAQRVSAHFHIGPMDAKTVREYIVHRLVQAGGKEEFFSVMACDMIYEQTGGVPRLVNQLSDLCMVYAFANGERMITPDIVRQVLDDGVFFAGGTKVGPVRLVDHKADHKSGTS